MMITAHSGCEGTGKNSMEYLQLAMQLPIDVLEIDVRKAEDGQLLLSHDPIGDMPLLTLEEAFAALKDSRLCFNCDLKEYNLEDDVLACAKKCGIDTDRILFTGSVTDCRHFMGRGKGITVHINAEELVPDFYERMMVGGSAGKEAMEELLAGARESGYDTLNLDYRVCSEEMFRRCREEQLNLSVWTVDDPEDMRRMCALGAANITTNHPAALKKLLDTDHGSTAR